MARHYIGVTIMGSGYLLKIAFLLLMLAGIVIAIWVPVIEQVSDRPVHAVWILPFAFVVSGFCWWIAALAYDVAIGTTLSVIARWLVPEASNRDPDWHGYF